jgi:hypothetical protein
MGVGANIASAEETGVIGGGAVTGFVTLPPGATSIECAGRPANDPGYVFTGVAIAGAATTGNGVYVGNIPVSGVFGYTAGTDEPTELGGPVDAPFWPTVAPLLCPNGQSDVFSGTGVVSTAASPFTDAGGQADLLTVDGEDHVALRLSGYFVRLGSAVLVDLDGCFNVGNPPGGCVNGAGATVVNSSVIVAANITPDPTSLCTPVTTPCSGAGAIPIGTSRYILGGAWAAFSDDGT